MAERCGLTMLLMFTARNYKVNWNKKHAACVERCLYDIYTEIPCLEMSGSNDMAVLNQVCFQTLFVVRHVNAIPNRILFQERNGSTTRL